MITPPGLSVVLATDAAATISTTLRHLHAQGDPARIELVIATLAGAVLHRDDPGLRDFPFVRIVHGDDGMNIARAEAQAVAAATAPWVVFAESCAFPRPGFVDAMIGACQSDRWTVVGPAMRNHNPASDASWAAMQINYGRWQDISGGGTRPRVPGHNSAYRRDALMALGPDLPDLMQSLTAVQDEIRTRGGLLCFDTSAQVEILNITGPGWYVIDQFGKGRQFARMRRRRWPVFRRLVYAAGMPLLPVVRLFRIVMGGGSTCRVRELARGHRCSLLVAGLVAGAAGECLGYLRGGPAGAGFFERNLHRSRYASGVHDQIQTP